MGRPSKKPQVEEVDNKITTEEIAVEDTQPIDPTVDPIEPALDSGIIEEGPSPLPLIEEPKPKLSSFKDEDIAKESTAAIREMLDNQIPACQDPKREEKLAAGWKQISPNMPLVHPMAKRFVPNLEKGIDDLPEAIDLEDMAEKRKLQPIEQAQSVAGTPFKAFKHWASSAPVRNDEYENCWSMRLRAVGQISGNKPYGTLKIDDHNGSRMIITNVNESSAIHLVIKLGVKYDGKLFSKFYKLIPNDVFVYGHRTGNGHYNHFISIEPKVFDVDGEAAIIARFNGSDMDARQQRFWLKNDMPEYIVDIQFAQNPMA